MCCRKFRQYYKVGFCLIQVVVVFACQQAENAEFMYWTIVMELDNLVTYSLIHFL
jgi:hypothetical protein